MMQMRCRLSPEKTKRSRLSAGARIGPMLSFGKTNLRGEGCWLATLGALTSVEVAWWALCWGLGTAPAPHLGTYLALSVAGMVGAFGLRAALRPEAKRASGSVLLLGTMLVALAGSLFLPLKYAIPHQVPFWLDAPLAAGERKLFGTDPWRIADHLFGWALMPVDRVYGLWLPVQSLVLFSVMLLPASSAKSRALIAYGLAWFLLGIVAAVLCASAGPIFYDRLLGKHDFSALGAKFSGGAWIVSREADAMWTSFATGRPGFVAGISAMPSLHVAISFWIWLVARSLAPRLAPAALAYAIFIWLASIQLGWHYVSDGGAGVLGMAAIWWLATKIVAGASA
jgi:hypothetical protein